MGIGAAEIGEETAESVMRPFLYEGDLEGAGRERWAARELRRTWPAEWRVWI